MSNIKMTVNDLRKFLEKQDPNLPVVVPYSAHCYQFARATITEIYVDEDEFFWECDEAGETNRKAILIGR